MTKFRIIFNKDAEEKWLNKLSREGFAFKSFFAGFYTFEPCEKGKYEYQIDLKDQLGNVTDDYREFMEENGIEIVQNWGIWVFLRKEASEKPFRLYTDVDSELTHYQKIRGILFGIVAVLLVCCMMEIVSQFHGFEYGNAFLMILLAIMIPISTEFWRVNEKVAMLKEKKTGILVKTLRSTTSSPLISFGLLVNAANQFFVPIEQSAMRQWIAIAAAAIIVVGGLKSYMIESEAE